MCGTPFSSEKFFGSLVPQKLLAVGSRCHTTGFAETLCKVTGGRKSTLLCNLCKTHIGGSQQFLTGKDPLLGQIIHRGDPIGFCESMRKIILVDLCNLCKFIQCNIFPERRINITLCPAAFAGFHLMERKNLHRRGSVAGKMDDQDVQQILADLFVIFLRVLCLFQDRTEIEIKPVFHFIGMEQKIFICIVNDKIQTIHTQYNIFQRVFEAGFFGVGDIRVDHDQIVLCDRKGFVFNEKTATS